MKTVKKIVALDLALVLMLSLIPFALADGPLGKREFVPEETGIYHISVGGDAMATPGDLAVYRKGEDSRYTGAEMGVSRMMFAGETYVLDNVSDNTFGSVWWNIDFTPVSEITAAETEYAEGEYLYYTPINTGTYTFTSNNSYATMRLYDAATSNSVASSSFSSSFEVQLEAGNTYYFNSSSAGGTLTITADVPTGLEKPEPETLEPIVIESTGIEPEASGTAHESTQSVLVDGRAVNFQMYKLKDAAGGETNYVKLRDVAHMLNGSAAQFDVVWDEDARQIKVVTGSSYDHPNGQEMKTSFSGDQAYEIYSTPTVVGGAPVMLKAFTLQRGGYTYYKLRDLGKAIGFNVSWSPTRGVYIETDKPYSDVDEPDAAPETADAEPAWAKPYLRKLENLSVNGDYFPKTGQVIFGDLDMDGTVEMIVGFVFDKEGSIGNDRSGTLFDLDADGNAVSICNIYYLEDGVGMYYDTQKKEHLCISKEIFYNPYLPNEVWNNSEFYTFEADTDGSAKKVFITYLAVDPEANDIEDPYELYNYEAAIESYAGSVDDVIDKWESFHRRYQPVLGGIANSADFEVWTTPRDDTNPGENNWGYDLWLKTAQSYKPFKAPQQ